MCRLWRKKSKYRYALPSTTCIRFCLVWWREPLWIFIGKKDLICRTRKRFRVSLKGVNYLKEKRIDNCVPCRQWNPGRLWSYNPFCSTGLLASMEHVVTKCFLIFSCWAPVFEFSLKQNKIAIDIAEKPIDSFRLLPYLYGETAQTFNAHALSHLADQVRVAGPLSSLSAMPFESAHFQLKRAIGPTTNSSCAAKLAVKKKQRHFFVTANLKRKNPRPSLTVGELWLKSQTRVHLDSSNEICFSADSFEFIGKNFYCHDSNCRWHSTGTCVLMVVYFCNNELSWVVDNS